MQFDAATTRALEFAYLGGDFTMRRRASFEAIQPKPGETILDIGCGNGLLTTELARAVGPDGRVIGIDPSEDMLAAARTRCAEFEHVALETGFATNLPVPDGSADKAASIQVWEYVEDLDAAAREAFRVLRPGGLLAVGDIHFDTLSWFSDDPERMARMMAAGDRHVVNRDVPAVLPAKLRAAGFAIEGIRPFTMCDHLLKPDGLAMMWMRTTIRFNVENGYISEDDAQAWFDEQEQLAREGRFFFSVTHFVVVARKP